MSRGVSSKFHWIDKNKEGPDDSVIDASVVDRDAWMK